MIINYNHKKGFTELQGTLIPHLQMVAYVSKLKIDTDFISIIEHEHTHIELSSLCAYSSLIGHLKDNSQSKITPIPLFGAVFNFRDPRGLMDLEIFVGGVPSNSLFYIFQDQFNPELLRYENLLPLTNGKSLSESKAYGNLPTIIMNALKFDGILHQLLTSILLESGTEENIDSIEEYIISINKFCNNILSRLVINKDNDEQVKKELLFDNICAGYKELKLQMAEKCKSTELAEIYFTSKAPSIATQQ